MHANSPPICGPFNNEDLDPESMQVGLPAHAVRNPGCAATVATGIRRGRSAQLPGVVTQGVQTVQSPRRH